MRFGQRVAVRVVLLGELGMGRCFLGSCQGCYCANYSLAGSRGTAASANLDRGLVQGGDNFVVVVVASIGLAVRS